MKSDNAEDGLAKEVKENNLLQINSETTRGRAVREIRKLFKWVPPQNCLVSVVVYGGKE